jgi:uncharacterized protein (DUF2062 family)
MDKHGQFKLRTPTISTPFFLLNISAERQKGLSAYISQRFTVKKFQRRRRRRKNEFERKKN